MDRGSTLSGQRPLLDPWWSEFPTYNQFYFLENWLTVRCSDGTASQEAQRIQYSEYSGGEFRFPKTENEQEPALSNLINRFSFPCPNNYQGLQTMARLSVFYYSLLPWLNVCYDPFSLNIFMILSCRSMWNRSWFWIRGSLQQKWAVIAATCSHPRRNNFQRR